MSSRGMKMLAQTKNWRGEEIIRLGRGSRRLPATAESHGGGARRSEWRSGSEYGRGGDQRPAGAGDDHLDDARRVGGDARKIGAVEDRLLQRPGFNSTSSA